MKDGKNLDAKGHWLDVECYISGQYRLASVQTDIELTLDESQSQDSLMDKSHTILPIHPTSYYAPCLVYHEVLETILLPSSQYADNLLSGLHPGDL